MGDVDFSFSAMQRRFVTAYLACGDATESAKIAGYASPKASGQSNLKSKRVIEAIEAGGWQHTVKKIPAFVHPIVRLPAKESLYLIGSFVGLTKIGISVDPKARLSSLQTGSPVPIHMIDYFECDNAVMLETKLHGKFGCNRNHGEWFWLSKQDINWIVENHKELDQSRMDAPIWRTHQVIQLIQPDYKSLVS